MKRWKRVGRKIAADFKFFRVREDRLITPRNGHEDDYYVIECPDFVCVMALTPDNELILVKQFRFGIEDFTLEMPGGVVDPGEPALDAAIRELLEETGHKAVDVQPLGAIHPNPPNMNNRCHIFLATGCIPVDALDLDPGEEIEVLKVPMESVGAMVLGSEVTHSLVISALYLHHAWTQRQKEPT